LLYLGLYANHRGARLPPLHCWDRNATFWEVTWKLISRVFFKFFSVDIPVLTAGMCH
jgi:hypothetical protein